MNNIRHIFFDLDNTLWDHRKNAKLTLQSLYEDYDLNNKINVSFEDFHNVYHEINESLWAQLRDKEIDKKELRDRRFYDTFSRFNYFDKDLAQTFEYQFLDTIINHNEVLEGTYEILDYLKSKNYNLHIITNGFMEVTERKLIGSNIKDYFDTVTSADTVGVRKPDPKIFQHCMEISGSQKENAVLVGDDWIADVKGSQQFGLPVVFFDALDEDIQEEGLITIKSLLELKNYL